MINILEEPLESYLINRRTNFAGNPLASKLRNEFPQQLSDIIEDKTRYKVVGSPGKGNWTECPWIAILDVLITTTPQSGYYPVLLFCSDMSGVYLSLNQGVTEVKEDYKSKTHDVLKMRAIDYRAKLGEDSLQYETIIDLKSKSSNARLYESGNIIAKYYSAINLPSEEELKQDLRNFIEFYDQLTYSDNSFSIEENLVGIEKKKLRLHLRVERNSSLTKQVKKIKGYCCEVCDFDFVSKYGELGKDFIEVHHLEPISKLDLGMFKVDLKNDFAVLCSNCHRMIHRMGDPGDLEGLKKIIKGPNTVYSK